MGTLCKYLIGARGEDNCFYWPIISKIWERWAIHVYSYLCKVLFLLIPFAKWINFSLFLSLQQQLYLNFLHIRCKYSCWSLNSRGIIYRGHVNCTVHFMCSACLQPLWLSCAASGPLAEVIGVPPSFPAFPPPPPQVTWSQGILCNYFRSSSLTQLVHSCCPPNVILHRCKRKKMYKRVSNHSSSKKGMVLLHFLKILKFLSGLNYGTAYIHVSCPN